DPPCRARYYEAFEWLMREMGAKPHWAKNFTATGNHELHALYGSDMDEWLKVRNEVDADGMFLGEWHHRNLPLSTDSAHVGDVSNNALPLMERETIRRFVDVRGAGDGVEWVGEKQWEQRDPIALLTENSGGERNGYGSSSVVSISASEESFDLLASVTSLPPDPRAP
ncbi:D-arabinono-1,4-lactone oxidase, partial [Elasticomyces elasticus]